MAERDSWEEDYSNPVFVKNIIQRTIEMLEEFVARSDKILKAEPPLLPAGKYPLRIKSINSWFPGAKIPEAYLLSVAEGPFAHKIHRRINPTKKKLDYDLYNFARDPGSSVLNALGKLSLVNFCFDKVFKKHYRHGFARAYPVSMELAKKLHLFDCRCAGEELIMTPKENLLAAESAGWVQDNMEFTGGAYHVARGHIKMMKEFGWNIDLLGVPTAGEDRVALAVCTALIDLRKIRTQLDKDILRVTRARKSRQQSRGPARTTAHAAALVRG